MTTIQEVIDKSDVLTAEQLRITNLMIGTDGKMPTQSEWDNLDKQRKEVIKQLIEIYEELRLLTNGNVDIDLKNNRATLRHKKP